MVPAFIFVEMRVYIEFVNFGEFILCTNLNAMLKNKIVFYQ